MRSSILILCLMWVLSAAAPAQILFSPERTASCLDEARNGKDRGACIGRAAEACRAAIKGATEVDEAACLNGETEWWRARIKDAEHRMMERAKLLDVEQAMAISQGAPRLTDDLVRFQGAWTDWAEQRCIFEAMLYRGKPERMVIASSCLLRRTAEQALFLDASATRRR
ncbi:Protein of unknown function [[Luteovulum] sphaeroides subsp. megalophilum]|uniref:lysozyme inhibitor LprI family protein n=1 Tax=Cereibacter sphaeroides TaxID=1063 RepID=UPI000B67D425|nr:lysozyme inhibitor LprI family protein [Cereibacter sphaeroides]SNT42923.1 Protein of unknown function [[Luteovulum] sphaeroides subsp. megalophilum]